MNNLLVECQKHSLSRYKSYGTAFAIKNINGKTVFVTNAHVTQHDAPEILKVIGIHHLNHRHIHLVDKNGKRLRVRVVQSSYRLTKEHVRTQAGILQRTLHKNDLAILEPAEDIPNGFVFTTYELATPSSNQTVYYNGFNGEGDWHTNAGFYFETQSLGIVINNVDDVCRGSSGSPILNMKGEVVAILCASIDKAEFEGTITDHIYITNLANSKNLTPDIYFSHKALCPTTLKLGIICITTANLQKLMAKAYPFIA